MPLTKRSTNPLVIEKARWWKCLTNIRRCRLLGKIGISRNSALKRLECYNYVIELRWYRVNSVLK